MRKLPLLFLFFVLFSCLPESDIEPLDREKYAQEDVAIDASGREYPGLDPSVIYCGPGWGRKFCRFLRKYEETTWADAENFYSDFSDIKFSFFQNGLPYFISFFNLESTASYCEGLKLGETTYDGKKWNIQIKKDEWDALWFQYDYYGSSEEIENIIIYKYEVIDGLLHFSSTEGQTFIFHPSEKNYSEDIVDTDEINVLEGCLFY
jgi:hypothetical protein